MKTVLILSPLPLLWFSPFPPLPTPPDLRLSRASWMTTPSSFAACWTCMSPRCRRSGWGGQRSFSSGRTCCSGMSRAAVTSAVTPVTTLCSCNSKRVRNVFWTHISSKNFFFTSRISITLVVRVDLYPDRTRLAVPGVHTMPLWWPKTQACWPSQWKTLSGTDNKNKNIMTLKECPYLCRTADQSDF